jgi:type IV pilus assembly protein PilC
MLKLLRPTLKAKILITLLRSLSVTLRAGVPILQALAMLKAADGRRAGLVTHLHTSLETGKTLAEAMETAPAAFPPLAVSLVRVGELSGTLQQNIESVVKHVRKTTELKRKIKEAMMYPCIVLAAMAGVGAAIGLFVLPQLRPLFESLDVDLPATTRLLMRASGFLEAHGTTFLASVGASLLGLLLVLRLEAVKPLTHRMTLRIPLVGRIQRNNAIAQITETLALLLRSGIPILDAIPVTASVTANRVFRKGMTGTLPLLHEGNPLSKGIGARPDLFPPMVSTLIEIGEATGTLADTLGFIAACYEDEVDYSIKALTTAIGPVMLIFIGVLATVFIMSVLTPLYSLTSNVG